MTIVIFNVFNISFSAGIQILYVDQVDPFSILAMLISITMLIVVALAQILTDK